MRFYPAREVSLILSKFNRHLPLSCQSSTIHGDHKIIAYWAHYHCNKNAFIRLTSILTFAFVMSARGEDSIFSRPIFLVARTPLCTMVPYRKSWENSVGDISESHRRHTFSDSQRRLPTSGSSLPFPVPVLPSMFPLSCAAAQLVRKRRATAAQRVAIIMLISFIY